MLLTLAALGLLSTPCTFDVLTYNVLATGGVPEDTLNLIDQRDADLVLLQEVTPAWARRLDRRFKGRYRHRIHRPSTGAYGYSMLSKHPLNKAKVLRVRGAPPLALCAQVALPAGAVAMCNAHLKSGRSAFLKLKTMTRRWRKNQALRGRQWTTIQQWMKREGPGLRLVAGDMNTPAADSLNRLIQKDYRDVSVALDAASATYPARPFPQETMAAALPAIPILRLDYVWASPTLVPVSAELIKGGGSDHLPIHVRMRLPDCQIVEQP